MAATEEERPVVIAVPVAEAPVLDGNVLGDSAWQVAEPATGFWQVEPFAGQPASEATEVRIAFTPTTLYVAVICYDSEQRRVVPTDARRDSFLGSTDSFQMILDTFADHQNGFVFGTNTAGIEFDAQVTNQGEGRGGFNRDWDTTWQVATEIGSYGWSAEFAIPFRSLRYPASRTQVWGINFQRTIARRNERAYWTRLDRQYGLQRVSEAGILRGLRLPEQRLFAVTPYALAQTRERDDDGVRERSSTSDIGIDVKYGITPSLTLDATYNTDFAQVEADEQRINLNRFNLFFPEKRPFFLENAGIFSTGSPGEVELFFSRRIGLEEGAPVPILGGVRITGKLGRTNLGFLDMLEDDTQGNNFTVARVSREYPNRSRVGAIVVNREGTGSAAPENDYNRTFGVDGQVGIGEYMEVSGYVAETSTPDLDGREHALRIAAGYNSPRWRWSTDYTEVGDEFNPEVGFLTRRGIRGPEVFVMRRIRPRSLGGIEEMRPRLFYRALWDFTGFQETGFLFVGNDVEWRNGIRIELGVNQRLEGLREPFEISSGIVVPAGTYREREARVEFSSDRSQALSGRMSVETGGFFGGDRLAFSPSLNFRLSDTLSSDVSWRHNDVDLPGGSFDTNLGRVRITYAFTTRHLLQSLVQYNDQSDEVSLNLRFSWLQRANTGLFVVYNELREINSTGIETPDRSLIVKYSQMVDVLR